MSICSLCSSTIPIAFSTVDYRRPHSTKRYDLRWCDACHYGFLDGSFKPSEVADFYAVSYYTHAAAGERPASPNRPGLLGRMRRRIAWQVDKSCDLDASEGDGKSMLDVGCGNGHAMRRFAASGFKVVGIEPDSEARSVAAESGRVLAGTAEDIPKELAGDRFDTLLLCHVLEHCIDPKVALTNVRGLLAQGGKLIVEVPNHRAYGFAMFRELWPWSDVPRHLHFFSEKSLRLLLTQAGFKTTRVMYTGFFRQFDFPWIDEQIKIWSVVRRPTSRPLFNLKAWLLLAMTAFASDSRKYDSVRIHAEVS